MKCKKCGGRFPANYTVACSPGGQEAPGTFLVIALVAGSIGLVLLFLGIEIWPYVLLGTAGFVGLQAAVALGDCNNSRSNCPSCGEPFKVMLWSF